MVDRPRKYVFYSALKHLKENRIAENSAYIVPRKYDCVLLGWQNKGLRYTRWWLADYAYLPLPRLREISIQLHLLSEGMYGLRTKITSNFFVDFRCAFVLSASFPIVKITATPSVGVQVTSYPVKSCSAYRCCQTCWTLLDLRNEFEK